MKKIRTLQEAAYEAESDVLRIFRNPKRPEWHELTHADQQIYSLSLAEKFAFPDRQL